MSFISGIVNYSGTTLWLHPPSGLLGGSKKPFHSRRCSPAPMAADCAIMAMGIGGRAHRRGPVHGLQGLPAAGAASMRQRVPGPGIGGMKTAAFVIKALALLIGLLSIY